jgi:hypothetical protein
LNKYNQSKYNIQDHRLKQALKILSESFSKIEYFYNSKLFKSDGSATPLNPELLSENNLIVNTNGSNGSDDQSETSMTAENTISETYRLGQLSDLILNLNNGNLIPLTCGHNGLYCNSEMEMFSLYLLNSKFL